MEDIFHFTGNYPEWYPSENRLRRPVAGKIVVADFEEACKTIVEPKLMEWMPGLSQGKFKIDRNSIGAISTIKHPDGSYIKVMTHKQPALQHEGTGFSFTHFDEPPPEDIFIANLRGLIDSGGRYWMTFTALKEAWIAAELLQPWIGGDGKKNFFFMSMDDNSVENGGYLTQQAIEDFCSHLDSDSLKVRREGMFGLLEGRIFKTYHEEIHVLPPAMLERPSQVPHSWTRYMAIDPHDRAATRLLWIAVTPKIPVSYFLPYREAEIENATIEQLAKYIRDAERGEPAPFIRVLDPNAARTPSIRTGNLLTQDFAAHGVFCLEGKDDIAYGHNAVREALYYNQSLPIDEYNHPLMYIPHYLVRLRQAFRKYSWLPPKDGQTSGETLPNPKYKHFMDLMRYLCTLPMDYIPLKEEVDLWETPVVKLSERIGG